MNICIAPEVLERALQIIQDCVKEDEAIGSFAARVSIATNTDSVTIHAANRTINIRVECFASVEELGFCTVDREPLQALTHHARGEDPISIFTDKYSDVVFHHETFNATLYNYSAA